LLKFSDSIVVSFVVAFWSVWSVVDGLLSVSFGGIVSVRTVVVVVVSPPVPIRRIVRYSVIVLPDGFGATAGGGFNGTGEVRVINCLRSLSTVTEIWVVRSVTSS